MSLDQLREDIDRIYAEAGHASSNEPGRCQVGRCMFRPYYRYVSDKDVTLRLCKMHGDVIAHERGLEIRGRA